ncbi:MAG: hypothetical protein KDE27_33040 [Planctomycetes bacterium]|nr:hypothetical protein [Planctomycetota bacterium]
MTAAPAYLPTLPDRPPWPLWQRVAFRYLLLHWLLYALPGPFANLISTLGFWLRRAETWWNGHDSWSHVDLTTWLSDVDDWFDVVDEFWKETTTRVAPYLNDWGLELTVIHQRTGSGDTAHAWLQFGCIVVAALLLTVVWSLLDWRRSGHPVLWRWLHLGARWWLAFAMLSYGLIKFYSGQFREPSLQQLTRELGDKSPMGMVWTFFGVSKPYEVFGGICETLGGLLLFHRRTALLGALVTFATMVNVCALNWLYDVPVKLYSTQLLLTAVFLLAPWRERLWALLVSNRPSRPVDIAVTHSAWLGWPLAIVGWLWVGGDLVQAHLQHMAIVERNYGEGGPLQKPELHGLWEVEEMKLDGEPVSRRDPSRWRCFAIDRGRRAWSRSYLGQVHSWQYAEDLTAGTITLTPSTRPGSEPPPPVTWTIERGSKTVAVLDPAPASMDDLSRKVDAERATLVLRGEFEGKTIELTTARKELDLWRGFHWVQELPYNR